jgi:hypothetical protein
MANKKGHRRFGNVRKLTSGRFQARYLGPDGLMRTAPETFGSKRDAEQWLTLTESEILRGDWSDPLKGGSCLVSSERVGSSSTGWGSGPGRST